jgi:hypothetical protein
VEPAGGELGKPFSRIFSFIVFDWLAGKGPFLLWGPDGGTKGENPGGSARGQTAETIFLKPGQGVGLILLRGGEGQRGDRF